MKIDEVTLDYLKEYMRIDTDDDDTLIFMLMNTVKNFIKNQTGLDDEQINEKEDLTIAYQILINDLRAQRLYHVENEKVNVVVDNIINQHRINLL